MNIPAMATAGSLLAQKKTEEKAKKTGSDPHNHVWTYDFMYDALHNGRRLKMLTLEDEFTREGLAIKVDKSIKARDVICTQADLFSERTAPMYLPSDDGPEFFEKAGFGEVEKAVLPHKIWADCLKCPKFPDCDETALMLEL